MMKIRLFSLFSILVSFGAQAQLTTQQQTAQQFVNQLLGGGVVATNITYSGGAEQKGSFNGQNSNIGLNSGLILATGNTAVARGGSGLTLMGFGSGLGNDIGQCSDGGGNFGASDPDIDQFSELGYNDAAILEFDFVAVGDSISFRYVFASEEYPEYVNSVNDVFGFFLSGAGISGPYINNAINVAVLPISGQEVSINSVNNGTDGYSGPCMNCQYYVYNGDGYTAPYNTSNTYVQYDGFTTVLTARAAVQCGQTYHIKMVIADALDTSWDSAVFLEAGSFASNAVAIVGTPDSTLPSLPPNTLLEQFIGGTFTISQPDLATQDTLDLIISGTATSGIDFAPFPVQVIIPFGEPSIDIPVTVFGDDITEGIETITILYYYINTCGEEDSASMTLYIQDYIDMTLHIDETFVCPGSNNIVSAVPPQGQGTPNYTYAWNTGQTTPTISLLQGSAGQHSVTVTDHWGETVTTNFTVIEPLPFVPLDSIHQCMGIPTPPLATGGAAPYVYEYDNTAFTEAGGAVFNPSYQGTFYVYIMDACNQSAEVIVDVVICETIIPNIFTPNGDEANDTFEIFGIEGFPGSSISIYNRWGALVYENDNYTKQWTGDDLQDGTYFYIFKRSDGKSFEGNVHLSR